MSPGVFVEKLAEILGVPSKSIVVIDRALLEAGLRSRSGRGRSAARVKVADAATLLLAVMATPVLVRANDVILAWRGVKLFGSPKSPPEPFGAILKWPAPLPLLVLLERLIETPPEDYGNQSFVLDLGIDQVIAMLHVRKGGSRAFEIGFVRHLEDVETNKSVPPPAHGDMTRYAKVSEVTFHKLHRLFHPLPDQGVRPERARRRNI
jgi:hypothetical protein